MKRAFVCALLLVFLVPAVRAADNGWPNELTDIQRVVKSKFGDIPYSRVKIRRDGNATDVVIKMKNVPRQFRSVARNQAGDLDLFLMCQVLELFGPDFDIFGFDVFPIADLISQNYGVVVINFGKKIKRRAEISVIGADGVDRQNVKKKWKIPKNSAVVRFFEDEVSQPGLFALYTEVGPYNQTGYFCTNCT